ncbi:hypothetical protein QN224_14065 [Sinorhizobium sp. 8-89]|uniref:hypothetical protein n=1 Tax=Sinorhizobium sp. 7-81 TaxID=3049087 RepID=UPI0024C30B6D|nr:hypothetical protein [Sinorhizobium sp. 7-81]MDK1386533.1 hypothetical protein [Sinorhizobium sp. 7-81]
MSDEQGAATTRTAPGPFVHYCQEPGCREWGSFGFALGKGKPKWYCLVHRPEVWPPAKLAVALGQTTDSQQPVIA